MPKGFQGRSIIFEAGAGADTPQPSAPLLGALEAISQIAHEAPSVAVGMAQVIDALCAALQWPIGHVYSLSDGQSPTLASAAIWHLDQPEQFTPFQVASEQITFRPGRGLVGQVLTRRRPGLSPDVSRDARFLRRRAAQATGVRAWLAFPVIVDGHVVAVCECFTTERVRLDPSAVGLLSCAGLALGRLYERERWQAERAQLLQRLADSEPTATAATRAALSALAGAIAHEINSPLFAARAGLALLAEDDPGEPLVASARADLARIAAVLETLQTLAQEAPLGQRLGPILTPPTA
jgi:signal transduction histidine kinase